MPSERRINSDFKWITAGMFECPKCWGTTELTLTNRDADGWPLGPLKRMTCDHCDGTGEVTEARSTKPQPDTVGIETPEVSKWGQVAVNLEVAKATSVWGQTT